MSSTALTDPHDDGASRGPLPDERAPSLVRDDDLFFPRVIGALGSFAVIFGATALLLYRTGRAVAVGPGWASIILMLGIIALLFHAAFDRDIQFRRIYMAFGYLAIGTGAFLFFLPYPNAPGDQFGPGFLCVSLGLLFVLCFLRHETDEPVRNVAMYVLGVTGICMALFGLFGSLLRPDVLIGDKNTVGPAPVGLLLALLGLVYLVAGITVRGTSDDVSYRTGLAIGVAGAVVFVIAVVASFFPDYLWFTKRVEDRTNYFMPYGVLLEILGLLYVVVSLFICSDHPLIVLTRRELGAFFYSPIAHLVLLSFVLAHWLGYFVFTIRLWLRAANGLPWPEPIVSGFLLSLASVIWTVFGVPVLTMRLISEEKRTQTLEQLLTAPVSESAVVLSKFFAAFIMFLITWLPVGFLMVSLRLEGGQPFDYRPLFSFAVGLLVTGSAFIGIGLFCSSLTRNQIIAGVLTFSAMLTLTLVYVALDFINSNEQLRETEGGWVALLRHVSYIDTWFDTLNGRLVPKYLLFPASTTVLTLFLSVKVLESRKWK
jgi:ABC-2 type transport system permease protein